MNRTDRKTKTEIRVEWIQAGQPRRYADSIYEAKMEVVGHDHQGKEVPQLVTEETARTLARAFVRYFPDTAKEWHEPKVEFFRAVDELTEERRKAQSMGLEPRRANFPTNVLTGEKLASVWHMKIVEAYTD